MRRFVALCVVAIVALSSSAAFAGFEFGNWYFVFSNWDNGGGVGNGPAWVLPTGPTATSDGAIWMKTGPGPSDYELNWHDFNAEIDFKDLSTGGQVYVITNTYLLSTGVANVDVNFNEPETPAGAYPGYWLGADGATGWGNNSPDPSPYRMSTGEFYLPTALNAPRTGFRLDLKIWLGNYNSFADAQAAGAYGADSGWFTPADLAIGIAFPTNGTFKNMPSLVLQPLTPTPEPSTIVLVMTGLVGLLAYAWRRRR
jgi:hypothetical protein